MAPAVEAALIVTCLVLAGLILAFAGRSTIRLGWALLQTEGALLAGVLLLLVFAGFILLGGEGSPWFSPGQTVPPSAPVPTSPPPVSDPSPAAVTHVVQRGDTLRSLARTYYGNENQWTRIYEANRAEIANPDSLVVGSRLVIPPAS